MRDSKPADINQSIYYKNRLDFSFETGCLPVNIPFPFDFLTSGEYNKTPLQYTLVPTIASLWWQPFKVRGPGVFRGNWDFSVSGAFTAIPRGPETRAGYFILGIRRNFVRPSWRIAPYLEGRVGTGFINAKEPDGAQFAQGQDFTFTVLLGSGVRYNLNPRYSILAGVGYMHISNLYLSEPRYPNYGINVYGPTIGFSTRIGKH
ncbi:MAG: acyloxyacyl hydrolase [Terriglobales bacterium]